MSHFYEEQTQQTRFRKGPFSLFRRFLKRLQ